MTIEAPTSEEIARPPTKTQALGVGVKSLGAGLGFIAREPRNWPLAMVPMAVMFALWAGVVTLSWLFSGTVAQWAIGLVGTNWGLAYGLFRIIAIAVGVLFAFVLAKALAQPLSGEALDTLCRRQELNLTGREWPPVPWHQAALRSLRVTLTSLVLGVPLLALLTLIELFTGGVGAFIIEPLKFIVVSMMCAWDLLDYPLSLRAVAVGDRMAWISARRWYVLGLGAAAAALMLVPGVGLLLLPAGAAGATRLVVHLDPTGGEVPYRPT